MKNLIALTLVFCSFFIHAQNNKNGAKPLPSKQNNLPAGKSKLSNNNQVNVAYPLLHDTCLDKQFSIVFYVIVDSTGSPQIASPAFLSSLIDSINDRFNRICVKFLNCSTVYIPVFPYGKWDKNTTENTVKAVWYTEKALNIYIVDSVKNGPVNEPQGYTYRPTPQNLAVPKRDLMVVTKFDLMTFNSAVPLHLLGDYFGLPHTYEEINPTPAAVPPPSPSVTSQEFVNGTNCSTVVTTVPHGDGFCDTEADPGPVVTVIFDGMGNPYNPPVDNYMSLFNTRCRFTQEQYNRMAYIMVTRRMYLH
ncbi:MAG: hypothetical protein IT236_16790 [Bacteroidia bacterium]|nr:hypothetical protein [Bacteroidia bacterium]